MATSMAREIESSCFVVCKHNEIRKCGSICWRNSGDIYPFESTGIHQHQHHISNEFSYPNADALLTIKNMNRFVFSEFLK